MNSITHNPQPTTQRGFTLVEIMVSLTILAAMVVGLSFLYGNLGEISSGEKKRAEANTDIAISLNLLERDIMMAGFAIPNITRIVLLNGTNTDRLFLSDGGKIMRDFTDNQQDDGRISDTLYSDLSSISQQGGGYSAKLIQPAATNTTSIVVNTLDINGTGTPDFINNGSLIISDGGGGLEGHRIENIDNITGSITLKLKEPLAQAYPVGSLVVPALCYHIAAFEHRNWLFRNNDRVIPDVENLQVEYGYDTDNNRILTENNPNEWLDVFPNPYVPESLLAMRVNLGIRLPTKEIEKIGTYTVSVELRN